MQRLWEGDIIVSFTNYETDEVQNNRIYIKLEIDDVCRLLIGTSPTSDILSLGELLGVCPGVMMAISNKFELELDDLRVLITDGINIRSVKFKYEDGIVKNFKIANLK